LVQRINLTVQQKTHTLNELVSSHIENIYSVLIIIASVKRSQMTTT